MVSVIIPNYNHAKYLKQRIDSVLSQTFRDFEVFILDDCSSDNSRDIIESYRGHDKISGIIYNESNNGNTFLQWQKGIELCKNEFVWIAESDDWSEPSFLETVVAGLRYDPVSVLGYAQSYCIEDNNIKWSSTFPLLSRHLDGNDFVKKHMLPDTAIFNAGMAVWRRSAFESISDAYKSFRFCGDWLFWIEICRQGNVFISGAVLNYFRFHSNDVTSRMKRDGEDLLEQLRMFRLLYERSWITQDELVQAERSIYIQYMAVRKQFVPQRQAEIDGSIFARPEAKRNLKSFYNGFYLRHVLKKIVTGLFE